MTGIAEKESHNCFGGVQKVFSHESETTKCCMNFSIFLPPSDGKSKSMPVLYYLSGLTCTEQNVIQKSGFQQYATKHEIIVVCPDTSPRGVNIEGEDDSYDFGSGAGFYVDATEPKWSTHYHMYSYVTKELPALIKSNFAQADTTRQGIFGHSMGGHGALVLALKNPNLYKSVSAFSPICNPINCDWGKKAFSGYLGLDQSAWAAYDSTELMKKGASHFDILIDQGTSDQFYPDQLLTQNFQEACTAVAQKNNIRLQQGYDHSYYFIATFIGEHIEHHAKYLCQ